MLPQWQWQRRAALCCAAARCNINAAVVPRLLFCPWTRNHAGMEFIQLFQQQSSGAWQCVTELRFDVATCGHHAQFSPDARHLALTRTTEVSIFVSTALHLHWQKKPQRTSEMIAASCLLLACMFDCSPASAHASPSDSVGNFRFHYLAAIVSMTVANGENFAMGTLAMLGGLKVRVKGSRGV